VGGEHGAKGREQGAKGIAHRVEKVADIGNFFIFTVFEGLIVYYLRIDTGVHEGISSQFWKLRRPAGKTRKHRNIRYI